MIPLSKILQMTSEILVAASDVSDNLIRFYISLHSTGLSEAKQKHCFSLFT